MKWAGLWVCSRGRRKSWQRGQRWRSTHPDREPAVTSGQTGESPETWIDFFERERERERTKFQISVDLPWWNVSQTGQRRSRRKSIDGHQNVISGKNKTSSAFPIVQLPLQTLLSLPSECELLNFNALVPLMSRKLCFIAIIPPCLKTLSGYVFSCNISQRRCCCIIHTHKWMLFILFPL